MKRTAGICSNFCVCARVEIDKAQIGKVLDFVWSKTKKPELPNQWERYLSPDARYRSRYENCFLSANVFVDYSKEEVDKKADEILSIEGIPEKVKEALLAFKKELPLQAAEAGERASKNEVLLKIRLEIPSFIKNASLSMETIEKLPKRDSTISGMLDLARQTFKMPAKLLTCSTFRYDAKKFRPVGGLVLPTQIPISSEISSKLGNAQLYGVSIHLADSKIGLEEVGVSQEKNYLEISTRGSFQLGEFDRFLGKPFELSHEYSNLLVEEI